MRSKRKRLGQHFLKDHKIADKIIGSSSLEKKDRILEIGVGDGILTEKLVRLDIDLVAIEIDDRLSDKIEAKFSSCSNFKLIRADALKYDFAKLNPPFRIISNLPYSISTPLIFKFIKEKNLISEMVIMLQKELALRITGSTNQPGYSHLSLISEYHFKREYLFDISADKFSPAPKVNSALIRLIPRKEPPYKIDNENDFFRFLKISFAQKRKLLINNLKNTVYQSDQLGKIVISITESQKSRAEELTLDQFVKLYKTLKNQD